MQIQPNSNLFSVKVPQCPVCKNSASVIPILYGLRSMEAIQLAGIGKAELGSHFFNRDAANWRCKNCGLSFAD